MTIPPVARLPRTSGPPGTDWQRLDPRMLLVHPIRELLRFLPVLLGLFVAGTASGGVDVRWQLLGVTVPVVLGLLRYLTTSFRIGEERIELRRGLLNKHVLSTRLDRVRTVDVTAPPIHRVLGLATLRVGTGTASTNEEDHLDLDGLPAERARALRTVLLDTTPLTGDGEQPGARPGGPRVVLRLDPAWARFAPLTSSGVALAAVLIGVGSQALDGLGVVDDVDLEGVVTGVAGLVLLPVLLAVVVAITLLAVAAYLITNWDFTLTHHDRAWHLHRGLFTTRDTSLDDERVAGVTIGEPIGLRVARGGRLSAIVTGLGRTAAGGSVLVPPAPRAVVAGVAAEVLGTPRAGHRAAAQPRAPGPDEEVHPRAGTGRRARGARRHSRRTPAPHVPGCCSPSRSCSWRPAWPRTGHARSGTPCRGGTSWCGPGACSGSGRCSRRRRSSGGASVPRSSSAGPG